MSDHDATPALSHTALAGAPDPADTAPDAGDVVLRALTDEGSLRAVVVGLDAAVSVPLRLHARTDREAAAFAELLAAAVLVRETVAPGLRIQMTLRTERGGAMVADSFPDGLVRGFIARPGEAGSSEEVVFGPGSVLQVSRQMPNGRLHQSVVPVDAPASDPRFAGEGGSAVAAAVEAYLQSSEQIAASSDLAAFRAPPDEPLTEDGGKATAAGPKEAAWRVRARLVQVMPGADREVVAQGTDRLARLGDAEHRRAALDVSPRALVGALLGDVPHTIVAQEAVHPGCQCSEDKVLAALATLGAGDLQSLVHKGEDVELTCDYCQTAYRFPAAKVAGLLTAPAAG